MYIWWWATMLPYHLGFPTLTGFYLTHQAIQLYIHKHSSNGSGIYDQAWADHEAKANCSISGPNVDSSYSSYTSFCPTACGGDCGMASLMSWLRTRKQGLNLQRVLHVVRAPANSRQLQHYCSSCLFGTLLKHNGGETMSRALDRIQVVHFAWNENG